MKSLELKREIHGYIEQADDKILQAIKTLVEPRITKTQLTAEQKKELNKRKKNHLSGKSKSFTLEETLQMVKAKK